MCPNQTVLSCPFLSWNHHHVTSERVSSKHFSTTHLISEKWTNSIQIRSSNLGPSAICVWWPGGSEGLLTTESTWWNNLINQNPNIFFAGVIGWTYPWPCFKYPPNCTVGSTLVSESDEEGLTNALRHIETEVPVLLTGATIQGTSFFKRSWNQAARSPMFTFWRPNPLVEPFQFFLLIIMYFSRREGNKIAGGKKTWLLSGLQHSLVICVFS